MDLILKVWRQKSRNEKGKMETYQVNDISADSSFLEMLDILNNDLLEAGKEPVAFDHDCREGICGMCSLYINGKAHGPDSRVTTCQLHMRKFNDGDTIKIDARSNQINVSISDEEIKERRDSWKIPKKIQETGVLGKYRSLVTSASQGAVTTKN